MTFEYIDKTFHFIATINSKKPVKIKQDSNPGKSLQKKLKNV